VLVVGPGSFCAVGFGIDTRTLGESAPARLALSTARTV
jgi:hypothetical protein